MFSASQLKLALKVLARRRFYTFISLFGIAFTLLVLTVASAMLDEVFGGQPPEVNAERSLYVSHARLSGRNWSQSSGPGFGLFDRHLRDLPGVELAAYTTSPHEATTYAESGKVQLQLRRVEAPYWRILRFDFVEGGPFSEDDDREVHRVLVINEATRERLFGAERATGRTIEIEGYPWRIAGVVRNVPLTRYIAYADAWAPLSTRPGDAWRRELVDSGDALLLGRSPGDLPRIRAAVLDREKAVEMPDKNFEKLYAPAETVFETVSRGLLSSEHDEQHTAGLWLVLALLALLFMSLPAINLVNINLSRILERAGEIGVRKAFGASSARLVAQFVLENLVLTFIGAAFGLVLAALALAAINRAGIVPYAQFAFNVRVFLWGLLAALVFGLLSGVYPAYRMSRLHPVEALRGRTA